MKDFPKNFGYFSLVTLLPLLVSIVFAYFFGRKSLKHIRENTHPRTKKFKIIFPATGIVITALGMLALIIFVFFVSKSDPTNTEIGYAIPFGLTFMSLGGFIFTVALSIIGFFFDRAIQTNDYSFPTKGVIKVLLILIVLVTAGSFLVHKIYFLYISHSPTMNESILRKALSEKNPKFCSRNGWCYARYYSEAQDSAVCTSIPDSIDIYEYEDKEEIEAYHNFRDDCYSYYAIEEGNPKLCDLVQKRDYCYLDYAIRIGNPKLCDFIQKNSMKKNCLINMPDDNTVFSIDE